MILAISGKKESGKDTVGKIIQYLTMQKINPKNKQTFNEFLKVISIKQSDNKQPNKKLLKETILGYNYWKIKKFADPIKDIVCLLIGCTREQLEDREFKEKELGEEWWYWDNSCLKDCPKEYGTFPKRMYKTKEEADKARDLYTLNRHHPSHLVKLTPRILMQLLGTECGRKILHSDIWINVLFKDYKPIYNNNGLEETYISGYPNWIITDLRFLNELRAVKNRDGITIRVNRPMWLRMPKLWGEFKRQCKNSEAVCKGNFITWLSINKPKKYKEYIHSSETSLDNEKFDYTIDNDGTIEELIEKVRKILIKENIL